MDTETSSPSLPPSQGPAGNVTGQTLIDSSSIRRGARRERKNPGTEGARVEILEQTDSPLELFFVVAISWARGPKSFHVAYNIPPPGAVWQITNGIFCARHNPGMARVPVWGRDFILRPGFFPASDLPHAACRLLDPAAAQHQVSVVEHSSLAGGDGALRSVEQHLDAGGVVRGVERGRGGGVLVANFDLGAR